MHTTGRFFSCPYRKGALRLKQEEVRFGRVRQPMRHIVRVVAANAGTRALRLSLMGAPDYLEFRTEPSRIASDSVAIPVSYSTPRGWSLCRWSPRAVRWNTGVLFATGVAYKGGGEMMEIPGSNMLPGIFVGATD